MINCYAKAEEVNQNIDKAKRGKIGFFGSRVLSQYRNLCMHGNVDFQRQIVKLDP